MHECDACGVANRSHGEGRRPAGWMVLALSGPSKIDGVLDEEGETVYLPANLDICNRCVESHTPRVLVESARKRIAAFYAKKVIG